MLGMFFYVDSLFELFEGDSLNHNRCCNFPMESGKPSSSAGGTGKNGEDLSAWKNLRVWRESVTKHSPTLKASIPQSSTISVLLFLFTDYLHDLIHSHI